MKKQSTRKGASIERSSVMRKITQLERVYKQLVGEYAKVLGDPRSVDYDRAHCEFVEHLRDYLRGRVVRFKKKAGGL